MTANDVEDVAPAQPREWQIGLVTVPAPSNFKPKAATSSFGEPCPFRLGGDSLRSLIATINKTQWASTQGIWLLTGGDGRIIRVSVPADERPTDGSEFPRPVRLFESQSQAIEVLRAENERRMELALVPRMWTLIVRRPIS